MFQNHGETTIPDSLIFQTYTSGVIQQTISDSEASFINIFERVDNANFYGVLMRPCLDGSTYIFSLSCKSYLVKEYEKSLSKNINGAIVDANVDVHLLSKPKTGVQAEEYVVQTTFFSPLKKLELKDTYYRTGFLNVVDEQKYAEREELFFNNLPSADVPYAYRYKQDFSTEFMVSAEMSLLLEIEKSYAEFRRVSLEHILPKKNAFSTDEDWDAQLFDTDSETGIISPSERNLIYRAELKQVLLRPLPILKDVAYTVEIDSNRIIISLTDIFVRVEIDY